jgi:hypothetical protein
MYLKGYLLMLKTVAEGLPLRVEASELQLLFIPV